MKNICFQKINYLKDLSILKRGYLEGMGIGMMNSNMSHIHISVKRLKILFDKINLEYLSEVKVNKFMSTRFKKPKGFQNLRYYIPCSVEPKILPIGPFILRSTYDPSFLRAPSTVKSLTGL